MVQIAICEDSFMDQLVLRHIVETLIKERHLECMIEAFPNGNALLKNYSRGKYDLVFLDIIMKMKNGIEVGKLIRKEDYRVEIVYITSSDEYALESYETFALSYLLKPYDVEKIATVLDFYLFKHPCPKTKIIQFSTKTKEYTLYFSDIMYVDSDDKVIHFNTVKNGVISIYDQLNRIEKLLDDERFLRCHQSYIVNMDYVTKVQNCDFVMKNKRLVPVRKKEKRKLVTIYLEYAELTR